MSQTHSASVPSGTIARMEPSSGRPAPSVDTVADSISRTAASAGDLAANIKAGSDLTGQLTAVIAVLGMEPYAHHAAELCVDLAAISSRATTLARDLTDLLERVELLKH